jgi:colanic acid/amylovoran biosynthesis protein
MTGTRNSSRPHVLLVGNGSYQNRGCEAIVRGTMEILRREFGSEIRAQAGVYADASIVREQSAREADAAVSSFCLDGMGPRWSRVW